MKDIKIFNANIVTPYRIIENSSIIIKDGKIAGIEEGSVELSNAIGIDANFNYLSAGFIDIHTHGAGGSDFMDGSIDAYTCAAEMHAKHGTTSMVPTTLTSTNEELKNTFEVFKAAKVANTKGAQLLGLHLEGPYFSMEQKGAQDPRYIKNPKKSEYEEILSWSDDIIRWSVAPELEGACQFARDIQKKGILPSIAHTNAIYEQIEKAYEDGFTHVTHLYSGMSGVMRINAFRYAGVIESAYIIDEMTVEIIADGIHLPASLLKLIYKIKGADKIALVTDSMRGAGMPEGESILGSLKDGQKVIIEDGVAKLTDRTAFAGSVATTDRLVRNMIELADVPLSKAVQMMTITPAKIIGVSKQKGSLTLGKDADLVIFDKKINIKMTIVKGRVVYNNL